MTETTTKKAALFKNVAYDFLLVSGESFETYSGSDHIRISEYVEVEFPMLPPEESVLAEIAALDDRIAETKNEFARKIDELEDRKAKLLALTHQED